LAGWKTQFPNDTFYFRAYCDNSVASYAYNEDDEVNADNDEVLLNAPSSKGLLFCHQFVWQRHLLLRYGDEICLLDATYKTSKYALPLFFICVRTNVDYAVVGSFITQSEDTASVAEALSFFRCWNPNWQPCNWMVDFSEVEIAALETVFPGM
jgi:hypothetical protein